MRAALEKWLTDIWYSGAEPPWLLRSLETIYRTVIPSPGSIREASLSPVPIIVVGNLTAGGTGKTPLVIALCKQLLAAGLNPGVISRGYGRKGKGLHIVSTEDDPAVCGDESLLLKAETGVPVILAEDRRLAITAMKGQSVDVIIADDGLQNKNLQRDIEICLVDGARLFGNRHLLPAGPLREPLKRLETVDYVVINGDEADLHDFLKLAGNLGLTINQSVVKMGLTASHIEPLNNATAQQSSAGMDNWDARKVYAVAAIGNPTRFANTLQAMGIETELHAFADHHVYTANDFTAMDKYPIMMTAKDAVKCKWLDLEDAWVLSVEAEIEAGFWEGLIRDINSLLNNKSENSA
ncbi:MAG: tetraacyldisaccharide 4'-kinase [Proteobacteria bacterium]|nr:tetraacyldisaccharide 4'-kinase [Pseudomonadota bacterium]